MRGSILSLFTACLLGFLSVWSYAQQRVAPKRPIPLTQADYQRSTAGSVTAKGIVAPGYTVPVVAPAGGWVREVFFTNGDYVRSRHILVKFMRNNLHSSVLDRGYVLAPCAGFLVQKNVEVGGRVQVGKTVAVLQEVSFVKVPVVVTAQVGQQVQVCDEVVVRVAELPTRRFVGVVERVVTHRLPQPKTVVEVLVKNTVPASIRPQMHANVVLSLRSAPLAAVARR